MSKIFLLLIAFSFPLLSQDINQLKNELKNIQSPALTFQSPDIVKKKNAGIAIIYSLLLPGMGELYADNYSSGKYFTIAEGSLWLTYIGINSYGGWQQDRYKSLAASRGGVDIAGKNSDYFATISEYLSIDEYNNEQALNRNFEEMYDVNEYYWNWQNPDDRKSYRSMWVSSEQAYNNLRFVIGGLILNRVISAINAVRSVSAYNKRMSEASWNISVGYYPDSFNPGLRVNFHANF